MIIQHIERAWGIYVGSHFQKFDRYPERILLNLTFAFEDILN